MAVSLNRALYEYVRQFNLQWLVNFFWLCLCVSFLDNSDSLLCLSINKSNTKAVYIKKNNVMQFITFLLFIPYHISAAIANITPNRRRAMIYHASSGLIQLAGFHAFKCNPLPFDSPQIRAKYVPLSLPPIQQRNYKNKISKMH